MQKITTCLWFDGNAEDAARFYVSVFRSSKLGKIVRHGASGPGKKGSVLTVAFTLEGREFVALNGGPQYQFTPAISLSVSCKDQKEVDTLWKKLTKGGEEQPCAWLVDKFGLSWQIVPTKLMKLLQHKNPATAGRVMRAMLEMKKIDIATLEKAAASP